MTTEARIAQTSLVRRIRQFYKLLNAEDFAQCYQMIDPLLLEKPSTVTLLQYETALSRFLEAVGRVRVVEVSVTGLHLDEPSKLYEGRDFAVGKTIWATQAGTRQEFSERWVCHEGVWYTRSTGLLKPPPSPLHRAAGLGIAQLLPSRKPINSPKGKQRGAKPKA